MVTSSPFTEMILVTVNGERSSRLVMITDEPACSQSNQASRASPSKPHSAPFDDRGVAAVGEDRLPAARQRVEHEALGVTGQRLGGGRAEPPRRAPEQLGLVLEPDQGDRGAAQPGHEVEAQLIGAEPDDLPVGHLQPFHLRHARQAYGGAAQAVGAPARTQSGILRAVTEEEESSLISSVTSPRGRSKAIVPRTESPASRMP